MDQLDKSIHFKLVQQMFQSVWKQLNHVRQMLQENIEWQERFKNEVSSPKLKPEQKQEARNMLINLQKLYKLLQCEQNIFLEQSNDCSLSHNSLIQIQRQQTYQDSVQLVIQQQLNVLNQMLNQQSRQNKENRETSKSFDNEQDMLHFLHRAVLQNIDQQRQLTESIKQDSTAEDIKTKKIHLNKLKIQQKIHAFLEQNIQRQQFLINKLKDQHLSKEEQRGAEKELQVIQINQEKLSDLHTCLQDQLQQQQFEDQLQIKKMINSFISNAALQQTEQLFSYIKQKRQLEETVQNRLLQQ